MKSTTSTGANPQPENHSVLNPLITYLVNHPCPRCKIVPYKGAVLAEAYDAGNTTELLEEFRKLTGIGFALTGTALVETTSSFGQAQCLLGSACRSRTRGAGLLRTFTFTHEPQDPF